MTRACRSSLLAKSHREEQAERRLEQGCKTAGLDEEDLQALKGADPRRRVQMQEIAFLTGSQERMGGRIGAWERGVSQVFAGRRLTLGCLRVSQSRTRIEPFRREVLTGIALAGAKGAPAESPGELERYFQFPTCVPNLWGLLLPTQSRGGAAW